MTVPEDGHTVRYSHDFFETVGDKNDCNTLLLEIFDDTEESLDLLFTESGCRLIHDDDPGIDSQRLCDLHHLLLGHREIANPHCRGDSGPHLFQPLLSFCLHAPFVHKAQKTG